MHSLIRFVVKADNEEDALAEAKSQLDNLTENSVNYIDYGSFFEDGVVGQRHSVNNWGCKKGIYRFDEEEARMLIMQGLMYDYTNFLDNMKEVKELLAQKTDDEIYDDSMNQYRFRRLGKNEWVVFNGEFVNYNGLRDDVENIDAENLWVIPCDVHT